MAGFQNNFCKNERLLQIMCQYFHNSINSLHNSVTFETILELFLRHKVLLHKITIFLHRTK